jgi:hypothetical protein
MRATPQVKVVCTLRQYWPTYLNGGFIFQQSYNKTALFYPSVLFLNEMKLNIVLVLPLFLLLEFILILLRITVQFLILHDYFLSCFSHHLLLGFGHYV